MKRLWVGLDAVAVDGGAHGVRQRRLIQARYPEHAGPRADRHRKATLGARDQQKQRAPRRLLEARLGTEVAREEALRDAAIGALVESEAAMVALARDRGKSSRMGEAGRARALAKRLDDADLVIIDKRRSKANQSQVMNIIGDVDGKACIMMDDMVDTAGTKEPVRITYSDGFDGLPVFSPGGGTLSWSTTRSADGTAQIFMADWNDAAARRLLGLERAGAAEPEAGSALPPALTEAAPHAGVLRPHAPDRVRFPGDDEPDAASFAAFDGDEVVGTVVVYPEGCPWRPGTTSPTPSAPAGSPFDWRRSTTRSGWSAAMSWPARSTSHPSTASSTAG